MKKTIFITGTSTGLGRLTAQYFANEGWNVAATMRSPEKETALQQHQNIKVFKLDVTDVLEVKAAVSASIEAFGKIDVVVNNAGQGMYGALELMSENAIDNQFAVNVRGPINVIRAFLPHFRANEEGRFINISSYMGITSAVPLGSLYNMSKFALEGLTEGLYYELEPLNIKLNLIEQGGSDGNNFVNNITWNSESGTDAYDSVIKKVQDRMESSHQMKKTDPQVIVDAIFELANGNNNQFRTLVGEDSKALMEMRAGMSIEAYLDKIATMYK